MNIVVKQGAAQELETDLLVVNIFEGVERPGGAAGAVDRAMGGRIHSLISAGDIKGTLGEVTLLYQEGNLAARRVLVVGLGKPADFSLDTVRHVAGAAAKRVRDLGLRRFATILHGGGAGGIEPADAAQAIVEGTILALYTFTRHKTEKEEKAAVEELTLVEFDGDKIPALETGAGRGKIIAESVCFARDLVNEPANYATPSILAQVALHMAEEVGLRSQVLDKAQIQELGMGALLGVAQGSEEPPVFIILEHGHENEEPPLVLVGKGITFDSGGISLKPGQDMHKMKGDMAGAAAVLGAMRAAALLKIPRHIVGLVPATENLPSGTALKPGDVLVSLSGKTIEVHSTDAEGRLILADALAYAGRFEPAAVVDIATLTGACVVALGEVASGLFSNDDALAAQLEMAALAAGEKVWRMPLFKEYGKQLESDVADLCNVGGRPAGAITAAFFLSYFAENAPWAHIDIAGTSWSDKPDKPYLSKGPNGVGVRLFVEWLRRQSLS